MYFPCRGGVRGGQDQFNWEDIKTDKFRENYLGHSLKAPVGRWQKGKDLTWYVKDKSDDKSRKESLRALKQAEEEAMLAALGHKVVKKGNSQLTKEEVHEALKRGQTERDSLDVERVQGMGYSITRSSQTTANEGLDFYTFAQSSAKENSSKGQESAADYSDRKASSKKHRKKEKKKKSKNKHKKKNTKRKQHYSDSSSEDTASEKYQQSSKTNKKRHTSSGSDLSDTEFSTSKTGKSNHKSTKRNEEELNITKHKNACRHDSSSSESDRRDSERSKSKVRKKLEKTVTNTDRNNVNEGKLVADNSYNRYYSKNEKEFSENHYTQRELSQRTSSSDTSQHSQRKRSGRDYEDDVDSSSSTAKLFKSRHNDSGSYDKDTYHKKRKHTEDDYKMFDKRSSHSHRSK